MLREASSRTGPDGRTRRWFADDYFDLFVWTSSDSTILRFQLCYGKPSDEHALTWTPQGSTHRRVDDGEGVPTKNLTPILVPDGEVRWAELQRRFLESAGDLDPALREFVAGRLSDAVLVPDDALAPEPMEPLSRAGSSQEKEEPRSRAGRRRILLVFVVLVGSAIAAALVLLSDREVPEVPEVHGAPDTRALIQIPRCQAREADSAVSQACTTHPAARAYLTAVHRSLDAAWSLPPGVRTDRAVDLTILLDPSGRVQCWSFPPAAQDDLGLSALLAVARSNPFPAVPSAARCLTEGALAITFRNPSAR